MHPMTARLLIVDDQAPILQFLRRTLEDQGHQVRTAATAAACRAAVREEVPDLILLDVRLPDGNGLELLKELHAEFPHTAVILMTAYAELETAVAAGRAGAQDFLTKPFHLDQLLLAVERALGNTRTARRLYTARRREQFYHVSPGMVMSAAPAMREIYETVRKLAASDRTTVLIQGESGVGKDVLANMIHATSVRSDEALLELNCAALPEKLLESELFGHEKGAFTGAVQTKPGLLELAHKGTLFLDEIGEMSPALQVKLLRLLEKQVFRRVGGVEDVGVDVRFLAATNRDLAAMVAAGTFREDLYYRLKVVPLTVPPLRERTDDVQALAEHFLSLFSAQFTKRFQGFAPGAMELLETYRWPGNVRELRNVLERAVLLNDGPELRADMIHLGEPGASAVTAVAHDLPPLAVELAAALQAPWSADGVDLEELVGRVETALIQRAYREADGNQSGAARLLRLNRDKIRSRVKKYGLP
ncbi:MAG TPA: sigma-54 dependent transcriptional regulator [Candidatus Krumholzibacteria bacterium]|nr:sigma-54 dependent transcriptional regulator [Candidatus Krumholzibacteria bacterium]